VTIRYVSTSNERTELIVSDVQLQTYDYGFQAVTRLSRPHVKALGAEAADLISHDNCAKYEKNFLNLARSNNESRLLESLSPSRCSAMIKASPAPSQSFPDDVDRCPPPSSMSVTTTNSLRRRFSDASPFTRLLLLLPPTVHVQRELAGKSPGQLGLCKNP
jgi:hypothetical protein